MKEKSSDKTYNCNKIETAVKRAIEDGIIEVGIDIEEESLKNYINEAKETGKVYEYWKMEDTNEFFRFQIEQLEEGFIYVDLGYRLAE
jgi:hypothetical protein